MTVYRKEKIKQMQTHMGDNDHIRNDVVKANIMVFESASSGEKDAMWAMVLASCRLIGFGGNNPVTDAQDKAIEKLVKERIDGEKALFVINPNRVYSIRIGEGVAQTQEEAIPVMEAAERRRLKGLISKKYWDGTIEGLATIKYPAHKSKTSSQEVENASPKEEEE